MSEQRFGLTEGLVLGGIPATAYWFAFLYQLGYCRYFDLPQYFIEINAENVLAAVVGLLGVIGLLHWFADVVILPFGNKFPKTIKSVVRRVLIVVTLAGGYAIVTRATLSNFAMVVVAVLVPLVLPELLVSSFARNGKSYLATLEEVQAAELQRDTVMDRFAGTIGRDWFSIFVILLFASFLSYFAGGLNARTQQDFVVLAGDPELVVLRKYESSFVAARFERTNKTIFPDYKLVPIDKDLGRFMQERVGPLSPPDEKSK